MTAAEKMAQWILANEDACCVCANCERCNSAMDELYKQHEGDINYTPPLPDDCDCIAGIVKYFEQ